MSWREKEDLGTQLVAHVHESLRLSNDYLLDNVQRGFSWWASDCNQRVWSDLGNFHNSTTLYRLHAEIDFLKGCGHAPEALVRLMSYIGEGSLSALVYDSQHDVYKLHCSIYSEYENEAWVRRVFNAAVALQICEVRRMAGEFATEFKMAPANSYHPTKGMRNQPDSICGFEESFFKPYGQGASRWLGNRDEWEAGRDALRRICENVKTDHNICLEASFDWPYGQRDVDLIVSAVDEHPHLGHGLMLALSLPVMMADVHKAHVALELNERERAEWNWCHDLGSWCLRKGELAFVCFIPNICHTPGILRDLTHDMAMRANWINDHWHEVARPEWLTS